MHGTTWGMWWRRRMLTTSAFFVLLGISCVGIADPPAPPEYGFLRVNVLSTGGDLDLDGFMIVIDAGRSFPLAPSPTSLANILGSFYTEGGEHTVTLGGVAANCAAEGPTMRSVTIVRSQITDVTFDVRCVATGISITTRTTGADTPDKLQLLVDQTGVTLGANGSQTIGRLTPGNHSVTLSMPNHCTIVGGTAQQVVAVVYKTTVQIAYEITCTAVVRLEKIAFVHDSSAGQWIEVVNPDGTGASPLVPGFDPVWSPARTQLGFSTTNCDDQYYYYYYNTGCSGGLVVMDPEKGNTEFSVGGYPVFNPSWARTGNAIAFESFDEAKDFRVLKMIRLPSRAVASIAVAGPRSNEHPSWSPDGTRIAFVCRWAVNTDICTVAADGGTPARMTEDPELDLYPAWSPDGSRIAFARTRLDNAFTEIVLLDVATKQRTVLTTGSEPAWSPDGSKLVFTGDDGLFVIDANGSNRRRLTTGPDHAPAWRP